MLEKKQWQLLTVTSTDWCGSIPFPIRLANTDRRATELIIGMTRVGGCVIYIVVVFIWGHLSILQNTRIGTCDL